MAKAQRDNNALRDNEIPRGDKALRPNPDPHFFIAGGERSVMNLQQRKIGHEFACSAESAADLRATPPKSLDFKHHYYWRKT
ncbi:MAG: hypothetical protein ILO53_06605 [Clostridia bacterium]|nr:hypothetical protein [Clostridia bacterium]